MKNEKAKHISVAAIMKTFGCSEMYAKKLIEGEYEQPGLISIKYHERQNRQAVTYFFYELGGI